MGSLTNEMKRVVEQQRLGFVATVCADGPPNLSPKGTVCVLDDDHLMFADIRSPATMRFVESSHISTGNGACGFAQILGAPSSKSTTAIAFEPTCRTVCSIQDRGSLGDSRCNLILW